MSDVLFLVVVDGVGVLRVDMVKFCLMNGKLYLKMCVFVFVGCDVV